MDIYSNVLGSGDPNVVKEDSSQELILVPESAATKSTEAGNDIVVSTNQPIDSLLCGFLQQNVERIENIPIAMEFKNPRIDLQTGEIRADSMQMGLNIRFKQ